MCGRHEVLDDQHRDSVDVAPQSPLHDFRVLGIDITSRKSGLAGQPLIAIAEIVNLAPERYQLR